MTIGILEAGRPPLALQPQWGTYATMIQTMLGEGRDYRVYDVCNGRVSGGPGRVQRLCGHRVIGRCV